MKKIIYKYTINILKNIFINNNNYDSKKKKNRKLNIKNFWSFKMQKCCYFFKDIFLQYY